MAEFIQAIALVITFAGQLVGIAVSVAVAVLMLDNSITNWRDAMLSRRTAAKLRRDTAQFELELYKRKQSAHQW